MNGAYFHHAYGLRIASPFPLGSLPRLRGLRPADGTIRVRLTEAPLHDALTGRPDGPAHVFTGCDGVTVESVMGLGGDHLLRYGHDAHFHLAADRRVLRCSLDRAGWEQGLAGPVLGHVSALGGRVVLAGAATASGAGAVALLGEPERSTSIAETLSERGHFVFSRGLVALDCRPGAVIANPGAGAPRLAGPVPLCAVVFVERAPGARARLVPPRDFIAQLLEAWLVPPTAVDLAERRAAGFEELVCETPVYTLLAGDDVVRAAAVVDNLTSRPRTPTPPPRSTSRSRMSV